MAIIEKTSEEEPLIQYSNIVDTYGVGSQEAIIFRDKYKRSNVFQIRADFFDTLIKIKDYFKKIK